MSPLGRPKGEYRRAQPEGCPMTPPGRPKGEYRRAQPGGTPVSRASRLRAAAWVLAALLATQARGGSPSADTELLRNTPTPPPITDGLPTPATH